MAELSTLSIIVLAVGGGTFVLILSVFLIWVFKFDRKATPRPRQTHSPPPHNRLPPMQVNRSSNISAASSGDYCYIENDRGGSLKQSASPVDGAGTGNQQPNQNGVALQSQGQGELTSTFLGDKCNSQQPSECQNTQNAVTDASNVTARTVVSDTTVPSAPLTPQGAYAVADGEDVDGPVSAKISIDGALYDSPSPGVGETTVTQAERDNNHGGAGHQQTLESTPYDLAASLEDTDTPARTSAVILVDKNIDDVSNRASAAGDYFVLEKEGGLVQNGGQSNDVAMTTGDYFTLEREEEGKGQDGGVTQDVVESCYDLARQ